MEYDLINTVVLSIVAAFALGLLADRMRLPTLFGYLMAGILVGPFTPGFVADISLAKQLAEIGIILLMFGVGLHFSFKDLLKVQKIAIPGAIFQIGIATLIGLLVAWIAGYSLMTGVIFGFSLSVASTVVLIRALERREGGVDSKSAKIAIGWLIVEDIIMVLALVLLPVIADLLANGEPIVLNVMLGEVFWVCIKISAFVVFMVVIGRKILPPLLIAITKTKSQELTTLGTLAISLGFAFLAYTVFDASFALGAFLAGMVLKESEIGRNAAEQSLPLRDAFAVLFFVSVGMLFDPMTMIEHPVMVLATLLIIIVGKTAAAIFITALFKQSRETSLTIGISLAQIGEFSFILAGYALVHDLIPQEIYNFVLAGAILSIAVNPFLFKLLDKKFPATVPNL